MQKNFWKEYFSFTKRERYGVFILLFIIAVFIALPFFWQKKFSKPVIDEDLQKQLMTLEKGAADSSTATGDGDFTIQDAASPGSAAVHELFKFDPNTLDEAGFRKLGLPERNIRTIINYRNKGGSFKTAEDIRKIYGLNKEDADRLIPYIQIAGAANKTAPENNSDNNSSTAPANVPVKKIDINTATQEEWEALPGIGEVLAGRIIKFRYVSEGFTSVYDVKKTYGLSDSVFNAILPYLTIEK